MVAVASNPLVKFEPLPDILQPDGSFIPFLVETDSYFGVKLPERAHYMVADTRLSDAQVFGCKTPSGRTLMGCEHLAYYLGMFKDGGWDHPYTLPISVQWYFDGRKRQHAGDVAESLARFILTCEDYWQRYEESSKERIAGARVYDMPVALTIGNFGMLLMCDKRFPRYWKW